MVDSTTTSFIDLKLLGCKDLKSFNYFQKLTVYALISIEFRKKSEDERSTHPENRHQQQQRTATDRRGGGNPEWNHEMRFDVTPIASSSSFPSGEEELWFVRFDLRHEGALFGDKTIGEVLVPLKDLMEESDGVVRFVSYQIRAPDGKPNGVLSFSCRFGSPNRSPFPSPVQQDPVDAAGKVRYPILELYDALQTTPPPPSSEYPWHPHALFPPPQVPPPLYYPPPQAPPSTAVPPGCYYFHPRPPPPLQEPWPSPGPLWFGSRSNHHWSSAGTSSGNSSGWESAPERPRRDHSEGKW